ncbi:TOMM precursor leader peptide-binding protein [Rhizobium leguminosarum]|uniref:TOMM precursor leader peptide-binding protein n=1 Tax=Rhizobium leguminosarum TaxID=384 RepID=UPI001C98D590|nr:TOMM precursor leader peptide-binding protein [Rhizobium leguminosarum]MBY5827698.1 TOMM precursor leader peptide-binding protein [Rhizobium leguminosarum]
MAESQSHALPGAGIASSRVRVAPHLQPLMVPGEGVFLLSETGAVRIRGAVVEAIFTALAGTSDGEMLEDDLVESIARSFGYSRAYLAVDRLKMNGRLVTPIEDPGRLAYNALANLNSPYCASVSLLSADIEFGRSLTQKLRDEGIAVTDRQDATLLIVVVGDLLDAEASKAEEARRCEGRATMLLRPTGLTVLVGPIFVPEHTGCWQCLEHRVVRNREVESYALRRSGGGPLRTAVASTPATREVALSLATLTASHFLAGEASGVGEILAFNTLKGTLERHPLRRRPHCPACGVPIAAPPGPVVIVKGDEATERAGALRTMSADNTFERWRHLVSPITGVVSYLKASPDPEGVLCNAVSGHNMALASDIAHLKRGFRGQSSGKGTTAADARAGALCEGIERHSGVFNGEEFHVTANFEKMGEAALHPNELMLFSECQYRDAEAINARDEPFNRIPMPFDPKIQIDWSPVWSMTQNRQRWLPTSQLYYGSPQTDRPFCFADSNGCAAGNTLSEAILQGFFELVERDAVAIWWYNRLEAPGCDLSMFDVPYLRRAQARYAGLGRELWVLDLTSDLGIPVFAALSRRLDQFAEEIIFGFGCHTDPQVAILRAITELNQFLPAVSILSKGGTMDDNTVGDAFIQSWLSSARVETHSFLKPHYDRPIVFRTSRIASIRDIGEHIEACRELVENAGLDFMVLDQTRSDIGMPVARVIVPGLRHFWARFAPGRLYEVPVIQGRLETRLSEEELNPVAMFV